MNGFIDERIDAELLHALNSFEDKLGYKLTMAEKLIYYAGFGHGLVAGTKVQKSLDKHVESLLKNA